MYTEAPWTRAHTTDYHTELHEQASACMQDCMHLSRRQSHEVTTQHSPQYKLVYNHESVSHMETSDTVLLMGSDDYRAHAHSLE